MDFKDYFMNEMIELRKECLEASIRNPTLRPFLDTPGQDPAVEQLLESFAFLCARLRMELDDELPEITHRLFGLLWPTYLRSFPATSILQYQPTKNTTGTNIIPKGSLLKSRPMDGIPCTFQTVYETEILPLRLAEQRVFDTDGPVTLAIRLEVINGTLANLPLSRVRVFFTGKAPVAETLYFTLLEKVKEIHFVVRDSAGKKHVTAILPKDSVRPVGFDAEHGLYPYPEHLPFEYRILQEYLNFKNKFLFVDIHNLHCGLTEQYKRYTQDIREFELHFILNGSKESYETTGTDNWQLFCVPIVNIFKHEIPSFEIHESNTLYKIIPDTTNPAHYDIFSVDDVRMWSCDGKDEIACINETRIDAPMTDGDMPSYRTEIKPRITDNGTDTYLSVHTGKHGNVTLNIELTCSNGKLPERLDIGDIYKAASEAAPFNFTNILPVSPTVPPPIRGPWLWQLLSSMSLNSISLNEASALRELLSAYAVRAFYDKPTAQTLEQILNGIVGISSQETDRIYYGAVLRGASTTIVLDKNSFGSEGALYLFSAVLDKFFALYATSHSFHQLTVKTLEGNKYVWPAQLGSSFK